MGKVTASVAGGSVAESVHGGCPTDTAPLLCFYSDSPSVRPIPLVVFFEGVGPNAARLVEKTAAVVLKFQ